VLFRSSLLLSACEREQGTDPLLSSSVVTVSSLRPLTSSEAKLTQHQIEVYINIKREMLAINQQYRSASEHFSDGRQVFKASMYQAKILAHNGMERAEFERIQERIIEAATRLMVSPVYELNESIIQKLTDLVQFKRQKLTKITNLQQRALLAGHIKEIEQQLSEFRQEHDARIQVSDALRDNIVLVRDQIQALTEIRLVSGLLGDIEALEEGP